MTLSSPTRGPFKTGLIKWRGCLVVLSLTPAGLSLSPLDLVNPPVVADGCQSSDVQHQRRVDGTWLRWFALRGGRALMTQHPRTAHPPQLRTFPWFLWTIGSVRDTTLQYQSATAAYCYCCSYCYYCYCFFNQFFDVSVLKSSLVPFS